VQRIGWILAILLALGWLASEIPLQDASSNDQPMVRTCWRRTVDGWENSSQWSFCQISHRPSFHPFYLGMMQCTAVACIVLACNLAKFISRPNLNALPYNDDKNVSLLQGNSNTT